MKNMLIPIILIFLSFLSAGYLFLRTKTGKVVTYRSWISMGVLALTSFLYVVLVALGGENDMHQYVLEFVAIMSVLSLLTSFIHQKDHETIHPLSILNPILAAIGLISLVIYYSIAVHQ